MPASIGVNLRVTGHCRQGGRKYMEDYFSVAYQQTEDEKDLEYAFFGIYDGHGGAEAAAYAKEHLMENIVSQRSFWSDSDDEVLRAVRDGFLATHLAMWKDHENWPKTASGLNSTAGTTASVAFIRRGKIYIGHVGDSGIVLGYQEPGCEDWKAKALTKDHKPENENEILRIQQCGGKVVAKSGVPRVVWNRPRLGHKGPVRRSTPIDEIPFLAVARSLGDLWSYNSQLDEFVVSPDPDCHVHVIDTNTFRCLVLGTDGLYNMVTPQMAVHVVQKVERHNELSAMSDSPHKVWLNPSKCLVEKSLERWLSTKMRADNTSVVTLMLDPPGPPRVQVLRSRKRKYTDSGLEISMRYESSSSGGSGSVGGAGEAGEGGAEEGEGQVRAEEEDRKLHSILYNQFTAKGEFLKTEDAKKVCSTSVTQDRKPIDASVMEEFFRRRYQEMRRDSQTSTSTSTSSNGGSNAGNNNGGGYFSRYRQSEEEEEEEEEEEGNDADLVGKEEDVGVGVVKEVEEEEDCSEKATNNNQPDQQPHETITSAEDIEAPQSAALSSTSTSTRSKEIQINEISSSDNDDDSSNSAEEEGETSSNLDVHNVHEVQSTNVIGSNASRKSTLRRSAKEPEGSNVRGGSSLSRNKQQKAVEEVSTTLLPECSVVMTPMAGAGERRRRGRPPIGARIADHTPTLEEHSSPPPLPTSSLISKLTSTRTSPPPPTPLPPTSTSRVLRERRNTPDQTTTTTTTTATTNNSETIAIIPTNNNKPCTSNNSNNNGNAGIRRRLNVVQGLLLFPAGGKQQQQVGGNSGKVGKHQQIKQAGQVVGHKVGVVVVTKEGKSSSTEGGGVNDGWRQEVEEEGRSLTPSKNEAEGQNARRASSSNTSPSKSPLDNPTNSNNLRMRTRNIIPSLLDNINTNQTDKENKSSSSSTTSGSATIQSCRTTRRSLSTPNMPGNTVANNMPTSRLSTLRSNLSTTSSELLTTSSSNVVRTRSGASTVNVANASSSGIMSKFKLHKKTLKAKLRPSKFLGRSNKLAKIRERLMDDGVRAGGGGCRRSGRRQ